MNEAIETHVKQCSVCKTYPKANQKETLLPHPVSMRPWHTVGADYFIFSAKITSSLSTILQNTLR